MTARCGVLRGSYDLLRKQEKSTRKNTGFGTGYAFWSPCAGFEGVKKHRAGRQQKHRTGRENNWVPLTLCPYYSRVLQVVLPLLCELLVVLERPGLVLEHQEADVHIASDLTRGVSMQDLSLYTSDAADDLLCVDLGGRRIIKKKKQQKTTKTNKKNKTQCHNYWHQRDQEADNN